LRRAARALIKRHDIAPSQLPSFGIFVALAAGAIAAIYYGAVPWALHEVIGATLWVFGYR
jgi:hypothetical protein